MSLQNLSPRQPLTAEEQKVYTPIFKSLDPEELGIVTGETARSTFEKSGLPPAVLGEIWQLVDPTNLGFLNQFAFSIALRLIGHVQSGSKLDKSLIDSAGPTARFTNTPSGITNSGTVHTPTGSISSQQPLATQLTSLPPLTNSDVSKFSQLFTKNAPTGTISGEQARNIFLKAKLPTPVLGQIWNLVDRENSGELNRDEFIVAMFLIQGSLNGSIGQLPPQVPQQIWSQLSGTTSSPALSANNTNTFSPQTTGSRPNISRVPSTFANASNDWFISPQKRAQFDSIFEGLDKNSQGVLGAGEVAPFLMTSKLPQDVLASIWDLADIHNTGEFTKDEFAIAMFLVQKKIAGAELPHIIPDSLYPNQHGRRADSRSPSQQQQNIPQQAPAPQERFIPQIPSRDTKPKSSLNDLVDLNDAFSTSSPTIGEQRNVSNSTVSYTPAGTKEFVPTSTFGQGIAEKQKLETQDTLPQLNQQQSFNAPPPVETRSSFANPTSTSAVPSTSAVAGTAAAVGAIGGAAIAGISRLGSSVTGSSQQSPFPQTQNRSANIQNNDLLADSNPEVSGQLSKATTDLANLSNQIGSLTAQTSQLNEKRTRAEKELAKVTSLKNDIESKLAKLRIAYDQEVKQTHDVEALLNSSRVETEELRKEASVAEAQYNQVQTQLQTIQSELEETQKENAALKERLGILNAEQIESSKQLEKVQNDVKQSKGLQAINSKQLSVAQVTSQGIKDEIAALLSSVQELDTHHEAYLQKQNNVKALQEELDASEKSLNERQQQLQEAEAAFETKEKEFQQRLEQQKQHELLLQQEDQRIQASFESLQDRRRQLEEAEHQLDEQTVSYAQRVQDFTYKQIEDATNGITPPSNVTSAAAEIPQDAGSPVDHKATKELSTEETSASNKGLIGAAVGVVAGAIGSTAVSAVNATESEPANAEFSSAPESTEPGTSVNSDEYQYRAANQFNHLDIQRPGSATSSIQNNAPQSVRGDDIEDIPSIDTISVQPELNAETFQKDYNPSSLGKRASEGGDSGAGSFELVDNHRSESEYTTRPQSDVPDVSEDNEVDIKDAADKIEASIPGAWSPHDEHEGNEFQGKSSLVNANVLETTGKSVEPSKSDSAIVGAANSLQETRSTVSEPVVGSITTKSPTTSIPPPVPAPRKTTEDEFPPIKELDIHESDTDSENEEFHETSDNYPSPQQKQSSFGNVPGTAAAVGTATALGGIGASFNSRPSEPTADAFEDEFSDLKEAKPSTNAEDDEFSGLQAAEESFNDFDDAEFTNAGDFNQELEGTTFFGTDGHQPTQTGRSQDNEEWEQIFAGFGNQNTQQQPHNDGFVPATNSNSLQHPQPITTTTGDDSSIAQRPRIATTPRSLAVQELEGMGFTKEESLAALEREKWNLEAATNYLLDNA